ncbi:NAD-dependent epimerase/dehydratase family protein [Edaphocola flava]|uniref:NAD-dependent epimerase/dehydratase family protein n=1 Tax=Edaphocola flava TaxID=2499629 RepID=UPI00100A6F1E|nr:NAD-dependent epimerase/dehydratase family protein [Edaphocola flava]
MKKIKVIITGATGMVGEGVLLHCLQSEAVSEVLMVNRRNYDMQHPKLKELLVKDFKHLGAHATALADYDACFFCAGISSVGMNEADYTSITYDTTVSFATALQQVAPHMVFNYITGAHTDSNGKQMWQKVKGRTEEALMQLGFAGQYNFRPGFMKPVKGQRNVRWFFKPVIALFPLLLPKQSLTLHQVGQAMIHAVTKGYSKQILEIKDIKILAR